MGLNNATVPDVGNLPNVGDYGAVGATTDAIRDAQSHARDAWSQAESALDRLAGLQLDTTQLQVNLPDPPDFTADVERPPDVPDGSISYPGAPPPASTTSVNLDALNNIPEPPAQPPQDPDIQVPSPPSVVAPERPGTPPQFEDVDLPEYDGMSLPPVPELVDLNLPEAPAVDLTDLDVSRPDFELPYDHLYDENVAADVREQVLEHWDRYRSLDPDSDELRDRWREMLNGKLGLPQEVEQALFDRAVGREDVSSEQAVQQARQEWASRGFSLPGSTVLAREGEVRRQNRVERGRLNREITIFASEQQLENLRSAVQQGVALEGQRFEQYIRVVDAARTIVSAAYEVARSVFQAHLEIMRGKIEIYQADIQAFREAVQVELARLEAYRTQLEGERIRGEINQQKVALFQAQLQALQTNVDVFRAEVEGANAKIQAQIGQMDLYRSRIDAYRAEWEGEKIKMDTFVSRVQAEDTRARVFDSQVRAFSGQIDAYRSQVDAAGRKVDAQTNYNEAVVREYAARVDAWRAEVDASIQEFNAYSQRYNARMQGYSALTSAEGAIAQAQVSQNQVLVSHAEAEARAQLASAEANLQQLRAGEQLQLEAQRGIATVSGQAAAAAFSAYNVGASISASAQSSASATLQGSASNTTAYNENYSGDLGG